MEHGSPEVSLIKYGGIFMGVKSAVNEKFQIGWGQEEITPTKNVFIAGLFHARVSEGIKDPLTVTALALKKSNDYTILVSCDLVSISHDLQTRCQYYLNKQMPEISFSKIILNATHTHSAPITSSGMPEEDYIAGILNGYEFDVIKIETYIDFVAQRTVEAIQKAWKSLTPGGISYGQGQAVVSFNRRWVNKEGLSTMYSTNAQYKQYQNALEYDESLHEDVYHLTAEDAKGFSHIEGHEDHQINLLSTYDNEHHLTGIIINVPSPSQEDEESFYVSADWWHETRLLLREKYGDQLFILPQCSAAGDLSPHLLYDGKAHKRMLALKGRTTREEIAHRIVRAVEDILPYLEKDINWDPEFQHESKQIDLTANPLSQKDIEFARKKSENYKRAFEEALAELRTNPSITKNKRWYVPLTYLYRRKLFNERVLEREIGDSGNAKYPVTIHILRLGDVAFASQPFECYLDYGMQIKMQSPAVQTFLIQLAGNGTYLPSKRSLLGGGYGSTPASNPVGVEGGEELVLETVKSIREIWEK